jgi:PAS domain S-box-containing protein
MLVLEGGLQLLLPHTPPWQASTLRILCVASGVTLAGQVALRACLRQKQQANHEILERKRLDDKLTQLNLELEQRIKEHSSELAQLNVELQLEMAQHKQAQEVARTNEERFRNMADNIQEGLAIIEGGNLVYANQRAVEILGASPEMPSQTNGQREIAPQEKDRLLNTFKASLPLSDLQTEEDFWITKPDGAQRCIHNHYSFSRKEGNTRCFVVISDITERVQAYQILEQAVQERTRELSAVLEISKNVASSLDLEVVLHVIMEQIKTVIPYSGAAFFTIQGEQLEAIAYQVPGLSDQGYPLHLSLANSGAYREAVRGQSVIIKEDIHGDSPLARAFIETTGQPASISFEHARAWIGIPLIIKERTIGLLSLTHETPGYYNQKHARLALIIANQVAVAMENARLYEQAHELATVEERQRIALELHDSVSQLLYGICLFSTVAIRASREGRYEQTEQNLSEIKENALQALQEMRLLIFELHPPMLEDAGLAVALQNSLEAVEARTGLQTALRVESVSRMPSNVERELFRIAMEALNNLVRFAKAKSVAVDLYSRDGEVCLEIHDNGIGFDPASARASGGLGLQSMEKRAKRIGGRLKVTSQPGAGTEVKVEVRLPEKTDLPG